MVHANALLAKVVVARGARLPSAPWASCSHKRIPGRIAMKRRTITLISALALVGGLSAIRRVRHRPATAAASRRRMPEGNDISPFVSANGIATSPRRTVSTKDGGLHQGCCLRLRRPTDKADTERPGASRAGPRRARRSPGGGGVDGSLQLVSARRTGVSLLPNATCTSRNAGRKSAPAYAVGATAGGCEADEIRAAVGRIRLAFDVAVGFEALHVARHCRCRCCHPAREAPTASWTQTSSARSTRRTRRRSARTLRSRCQAGL